MDGKVKKGNERTDKLFTDVQTDMMDNLRIQERQIQNLHTLLRTKVRQLDEEMHHMLKTDSE